MWSLGVLAYELFTGEVPYEFGNTEIYCRPPDLVFENSE